MELPLSKCKAQVAASHALLNCLVKEFALPEHMISYEWPENMDSFSDDLLKTAASKDLLPLHIKLPLETDFLTLVDRKSSLGNYHYHYNIYGKSGRESWKIVDAYTLAAKMIDSCATLTGDSNQELLSQIHSSVELKKYIVDHAKKSSQSIASSNYISSEQNLWFGHPSHPAPKARLWPEGLPHQDFSPEFAITTRLHLLEVPKSGMWIGTNLLSSAQVLAGLADQSDCSKDTVRISLHPVQANIFLSDPRVQTLIQAGTIKDLGLTGFQAAPTASLRTMYIPGHPFFIKGSLNVRITNCVRKNAWYELKSALFIDSILGRLSQESAEKTGYLQHISEPGAAYWSPEGASEADKVWFAEQTGAILRQNFCLNEGENNCLLAGTLFAKGKDFQPNTLDFLQDHFAPVNNETLLNWFDKYQQQLLTPVLSLFYNFGIVLEPHLQNTVVVHRNGDVIKLLLRDYEGVKLTDDKGSTLLTEDIHPRVRQSIVYTRENGWNRLSYCLFVNNLSEAILALTYRRPMLAHKMWQMVLKQLVKIKQTIDDDTPELDALIDSGIIQCKTNFKVRLAAQADKKAQYVSLRAPWLEETL